MNLLMKTAVVTGAAVMTGCAMMMEPMPETSVPLVSTDKVFEYPKGVPNGKTISERALLRNMEKQIMESSGVLSVEDYSQFLSDHRDVKGLMVEQKDSQIDVSFINGNQYSDDGELYKTAITASYGVSFEDTGDRLRMTVATPSEFVIEPGRQPIGNPIDPLFGQDRAEQEFYKINEGIAPALTFNESITGSIESPWAPDSVSDNFDRLLEKNPVNGEYEVTAAGETATAKVDIFSYRNGSKVEYKLLYTYQATGDGSFTRSQADIDALIERLREVATD